MTDILGVPGICPTMALDSSSGVKSTRPPLIFSAYFMNINFMAFSLLQVPHIMVMMFSVPAGAILIKTSLSLSPQLSPEIRVEHSHWSRYFALIG